jgi:flagellar biosynthesis/type III secretory pathway protein FliH
VQLQTSLQPRRSPWTAVRREENRKEKRREEKRREKKKVDLTAQDAGVISQTREENLVIETRRRKSAKIKRTGKGKGSKEGRLMRIRERR